MNLPMRASGTNSEQRFQAAVLIELALETADARAGEGSGRAHGRMRAPRAARVGRRAAIERMVGFLKRYV